jgi:hypothetical protein
MYGHAHSVLAVLDRERDRGGPLTVGELRRSDAGRRIRVVAVAPSQAEKLGYCDDTDRLLGQTGRLTAVIPAVAQAWVKWDGERPGRLMLAGLDTVEFIQEEQ